MKLPKRLHLLYDLAEGDELWDIGCDHSLLARINLRERRFSTVFCVDKSKNSLNKIQSNEKYTSELSVVLIHCDGCHLDWDKVQGSVVIAGVGGNTVIKIIQSCPVKKRRQLVWLLNPFTSVERFVTASSQLFDEVPLQKFETIENGRTRSVYKWKCE